MLSKSEIKLKNLLNILLPNEVFIDNYRPDWLKNPATNQNLELDRYYPNLKIGIEFNGSQHRFKNDSFQWKRDQLKNKLCGKQGVIKLVFYWKDLSLETISNRIKMCSEMRKAWASGKSYKK